MNNKKLFDGDFEWELKFRIHSMEAANSALQSQKLAALSENIREEDWYFTSQHTDCLVLLRRMQKDERIIWIVKNRPNQLCLTNDIQEFSTGTKMLQEIGYSHTATIVKHRDTYFNAERVYVCIDRVDDLGEFAEVAAMYHQTDAEDTIRKVTLMANKLDFGDPIKKSYYELWMEKHNGFC